ncbi:unnamed protein product [Brassicogethes aeneus]|uniref:RCC1-like domain-containing protein n=1 Tax=Brassicogethes aeneus TaxID=1431903 RepID=A0A9P0F8H6_BRAAE|nr:unnamed protein product [Brassicogethes aeneus]
MPPKRRRQSQTDVSVRAKRVKFTLDNARIPETDVEGVVLVTGSGDTGQLGLGPDVMEKTRPALVNLEQEIVDICAGGMHTVCLTKDGKVLTFGCNDEGALGRVTEGKDDAEFTAGEVKLPGRVMQVSAGDSHTAALMEDGRVFAWGTFRDSHGSMGLTLNGNEKMPYEILSNVHVVKIASGADHIVFLTNSGEVYTCGCAEQGQLGRTSERGSSRHSRGSIGKGALEKLLKPAPISLKPSLKLHFDNIWTGTYGTFCKVANKDDVYVFGLNNYYQLGLDIVGPQYVPVLSKEFSRHEWNLITCAQHHTICLTTGGKAYAIGRKEYGRLGLGEQCDEARELKEIEALSGEDLVDVACGSSVSFAVTKKGDLYAWGMGDGGQLGTGEEEDCFEPKLIKSKQLQERKVFRVSAGGQHTVILAINNNNN